MRTRFVFRAVLAAASLAAYSRTSPTGLTRIENIVVIFAENRSFDVLYGSFPGANGLKQASPGGCRQVDRDGTVLKELPPVWNGLTAAGVTPPITEAQTAHLPNKQFGNRRPECLQNTPSCHYA